MSKLTARERALIAKLDTPAKVQRWLDGLKYNFDGKKPTLRSLRRVIEDRKAHCLEGAVAAAAILSHHGYPPLMMCIEARDIDHNLFVWKENGLWGAIAKSRDDHLTERPPRFHTPRDLALAYYGNYWNYWTGDKNDLTARGWALIDLSKLRRDWVTAPEELFFIEDALYQLSYRALFPKKGRTRFLSPRKGPLKWLG